MASRDKVYIICSAYIAQQSMLVPNLLKLPTLVPGCNQKQDGSHACCAFIFRMHRQRDYGQTVQDLHLPAVDTVIKMKINNVLLASRFCKKSRIWVSGSKAMTVLYTLSHAQQASQN